MSDPHDVKGFSRSEYVSDFESDTRSEVDSLNISRADDDFDLPLRGNKRSSTFLNPPETKKFLKKEGPGGSQLLQMDAYQRHKQLVNNYFEFYGGSIGELQADTSKYKRDIDVIKENNRFVWSEDDVPNSWEERLAKRYWERLFKEYCVADISRYMENKFGLRWRTEREVVSGKGQFVCGSLFCSETKFLRSWEVNFAYRERGTKRNALIKLRLCPSCSDKLNHHKQHCERILDEEKKSKISELKDTSPNSKSMPISDLGSDPSAESNKSADTSVWKNASTELSSLPVEAKPSDDEFSDYFKDMFM